MGRTIRTSQEPRSGGELAARGPTRHINQPWIGGQDATHTAGRAVIGRFAATDARDKIAQARALAKAQAFPLWIGVEPA